MHESNLARPIGELAEQVTQPLLVSLTPVEIELLREPTRKHASADRLLASGRPPRTRRKHRGAIRLDSGIYRPYRSF